MGNSRGRMTRNRRYSRRASVVREICDCAVVGFSEQVTTDTRGAHRKGPWASAGCSPGRHFARGRVAGPQGDHGFKCRGQVRIAGEQDGHVAFISGDHHDEVDGERHVDALLLGGSSRPVVRIAEIACDDRHEPLPAADLLGGLSAKCGV